MRRPLKPFITEYKASNRRAHAPSGDAAVIERQPAQERVFSSERASSSDHVFSGERDRFATKAFDSSSRQEPHDSYEAALRAADALFAPRPASEQSRAPIPAAPDADKVFAPKAVPPQAKSLPADTLKTAPAEARVLDETVERPSAPEKGGRILPALDETPLPQFAALEEAHTPKRRGRKPGSKNKPRVTSGEQLSFIDRTPVAEVVATPARAESPAAAPQRVTPRSRQTRRPLESSETWIEARVPTPMSRLRFSWLDRKLKPGEFWKRRLPKVCW